MCLCMSIPVKPPDGIGEMDGKSAEGWKDGGKGEVRQLARQPVALGERGEAAKSLLVLDLTATLQGLKGTR